MLEMGEKTKFVFLSFVKGVIFEIYFFLSIFKLKVEIGFKDFPLVDRKSLEEVPVVRIYGTGIEMDGVGIFSVVNFDEDVFNFFEFLSNRDIYLIVIFIQFFLSS